MRPQHATKKSAGRTGVSKQRYAKARQPKSAAENRAPGGNQLANGASGAHGLVTPAVETSRTLRRQVRMLPRGGLSSDCRSPGPQPTQEQQARQRRQGQRNLQPASATWSEHG